MVFYKGSNMKGTIPVYYVILMTAGRLLMIAVFVMMTKVLFLIDG